MMIEDVITFWFADPTRWFRKDPAFDEELRSRFGELHAAIRRGEHEAWRSTARGALAYVLVLDQFSRNLFRGAPESFASDPQALGAAREALERGFDRELPSDQASFFLMPFMHSESLDDQDHCVAWFEAAGTFADNLKYAEQHRDIIRRFGRFPHRNAILGRASTPDELAFLEQPGSSF